ncbi:MBL fold metallo-hydrolase [Pleionea mediterranea]|uniref:Glyoxylase-like metal-dependent hydrolase (Beta-lactamase superfamily II) n=1 Tax=Pleionea mediterranea TaxID=523701 RepID=A0A316FYW3_9GAMM|nr:MBL fold metallo-hydrolase [Pleionea mediterranea]PWK53894.1 glyoxylase-like metal-dependent hydrolase (beta-lactamase superfamily II) [Pleionea mediterranea]
MKTLPFKLLLQGVIKSRFITTGLLALTLLSHTIGFTETQTAQPNPVFTTHDLGNGVIAFIKPDPLRFNDANITAIINKESVIIVDANSDLNAAEQIIAAIKSRTDKPVTHVINTHWHSDHTMANQLYQQAFAGKQIFVGHQSLTNTIVDKTQPQLDETIENLAAAIKNAEDKLASDNNDDNTLAEKIARAKAKLEKLKTINLVKPDKTFTNHLDLSTPDRRIELFNFGTAHTEGDTIVFLPDDKILIAGDLFDEIPFAGHGYPESWLATLNKIKALDFERVIPGHGSIHQGKQQLEKIITLLTKTLQQASHAVNNKMTLEQFMSSINKDEFKQSLASKDELAKRAYNHFIEDFYKQAYLSIKKDQ